MAVNSVDLMRFFQSFDNSNNEFKKFIMMLKETNLTVAVLALDNLFKIEDLVQRKQLTYDKESLKYMKDILLRWRQYGHETDMYYHVNKAHQVLRNLSIFEILEVPMFIDDYGVKCGLESFSAKELIPSLKDATIYHVTHAEEGEMIYKDRAFKASDSKNTIKGVWFGFKDPSSGSVYGSSCFETTLGDLGIPAIQQGEIVTYKQEVNVILYADNKDDVYDLDLDTDLWMPTIDAARQKQKRFDAYVNISIFIPERFLPKNDFFTRKIKGPITIPHKPFCIREKRTDFECKELSHDEFEMSFEVQ